MARKLVHYRDIRLAANAGMSWPVCKTTMDGRSYETTSVAKDVTCTRCPAAHAELFSWAGAKGFTHPAQDPSRLKSRGSKKNAQSAAHVDPEAR